MLQEVHAKHRLERQRASPPTGPGRVRRHQREQPRPWDHGVHLGQEPLAARDLALNVVRHTTQRPLLAHDIGLAREVAISGAAPQYKNRTTVTTRAEVP